MRESVDQPLSHVLEEESLKSSGKLTANCPHCHRFVEFERFHAGFSNEGYLYCDSDAAVLTWDSYHPQYVRLVGEKHPWMLSKEEQRRVEDALKPCPYGGRFTFANPPKCPHCLRDISSFVAEKVYFIVTGPRLKAEEVDVWKRSVSGSQ
jgi:hypothetical protein